MKRTVISLILSSVFSSPLLATQQMLPTNYDSTLNGEYELNQATIQLTQGTGMYPKFYKIGTDGATITLATDSVIALDNTKGSSSSSLFYNFSGTSKLNFIGDGHRLTFKHNSVSKGSAAGDISTFYGKNFYFEGLSSLTIDNTYKTTNSRTQNVGYGLYLLGESTVLSTKDHKLQTVDVILTSEEKINQLNAIRLSDDSEFRTDADNVNLTVSLNEQEGYSKGRKPSSGILFRSTNRKNNLNASFNNINPNSTLSIDITSKNGDVAAISYEDKIGEVSIATNSLKANIYSIERSASGLYIGPAATPTQGSSISLNTNTAVFNVTSDNGCAYGINFYNYDRYDGSIDFNGDVEFTITSNDVDGWASGLDSANQNVNLTFDKDAKFTVTGKNSVYGLDIFSSFGSSGGSNWHVSQTKATFNGNVYIKVESENSDANAYAIKNIGGDIKIGVTEDGQRTNGKLVQIKGDIYSTGMDAGNDKISQSYEQGSGTLLVGLSGSDSYLKGKVTDRHMDQEDHRTELFIENGAYWDVTAESEVGAIHANGGSVNLTDSTSTVTINDLTVTDQGLNVYVNEVTDNPLVTVTNKTGNGKIGVTGSSEVNDSYTNVDDMIQDLASAVVQTNGTSTDDKSLVDNVTAEEGKIRGEVNSTLGANGEWQTTVKENVSLDGYSSIASLAAVNWRHEMNDLTKRMGELRDSTGKVGAWARAYGSELEYGKQSVSSKNTSIQVGADYALTDEWKVGAAFNYTDGSMTFDRGDGDNKAYGFAVYGTWMAENGLFVDLIGKYSRLSTEFSSGKLNGDYDNNGWSLSAEAGWQFKPIDEAFIEPQVELTYGRLEV